MYERYTKKELLKTFGCYKKMYRAYDDQEGIEVTWHQVSLTKEEERKMLFEKLKYFEQIQHPNIIQIYDSWRKGDDIIYITEMIYSGTLNEFLENMKKFRLKIIKKWCKFILNGLLYLHSLQPPLIHRHVTYDNIYVSANEGTIKLGDVASSILFQMKRLQTSISPEYFAPELFEEEYDEKIDIYSFGICLLEMVTGKIPYSEAKNICGIYKRLSQGILPEALQYIKNRKLKDFIQLCLKNRKERPSIMELLKHPFLEIDEETDNQFIYISDLERNQYAQNGRKLSIIYNGKDFAKAVVIQNLNQNVYQLKLYIRIHSEYKEVKFPFDLKKDSVLDVAKEITHQFDLYEQDTISIAKAIHSALKSAGLNYKKREIHSK